MQEQDSAGQREDFLLQERKASTEPSRKQDGARLAAGAAALAARLFTEGSGHFCPHIGGFSRDQPTPCTPPALPRAKKIMFPNQRKRLRSGDSNQQPQKQS